VTNIKQKKCKVCFTEFKTTRSLQQVCGLDCAVEFAKRKAYKAEVKEATRERVETRKAKSDARPLKYWADKAQIAINRWIVHGRDKDLPCISCGTTNHNIQYCASHYRSRKAASQLRYNEDNLHKACNHYCNQQLSGNIENYRPALIAKIGQERHDALINNHETKRWSKEECQEIERIYKAKLKALNDKSI
jgi:hypothetical protein